MTARQATTLLLHALAWGAAYVFVASALDGYSPLQVVVGRMLIATAVLGLVARAQGHRASAVVAVVRDRPGPAIALALANCVVPFLVITAGQQTVSASLTGILVASVPIWTALLALRLDPTGRLGARGAVGVAVGLGGVVLAILASRGGASGEALGIGLVLLGAASYGLCGFLVQRHWGDVPTTLRGLVVFVVSCAVLVPLAPLGGGVHVEAGPTAALVALGVISTAAAFVLGFMNIDALGPHRAALASYLAPGCSILLAALLLQETITLGAVAGLALIVAGVAIGTSGPRHARPAPAPRRARAPEATAHDPLDTPVGPLP